MSIKLNSYKTVRFFLLASLMLGFVKLEAQTTSIKNAINHFNEAQYQLVIDDLSETLSRNDRDIKANYYVGAAYVCLNKNISESIRRLKYAQVKGITADSYYYLGRAYQLNYEFELAIQTFDKFLKTAKNQQLIDNAKIYRAQCENSVTIASKLFDVKVIDKYKVTTDSVLYVYRPSKEVGQIQHNSDFFESDINPNGILYRTERGDAVYFSLPDGTEKEKLYKIERLLDGWGDMTPLSGLASEGNDQMPIMMTDGTTLYFSSDREGGMGGLDIYKSTYDIESRSFTEPINMGVPFNSAFDDYLFVGDEFQQRAWFASNRETSADSAFVYEIVWDDSVIKNFAQNTEEIRAASALNISTSLANLRSNKSNINKKQANINIAKEIKKFEFVINDSLTYTQWDHFRSEIAKVKYSKAFSLQNQHDSLSNLMTSKRKLFANITSDDKRSELINEILKIERSVYSLDDEIKELSTEAQRVENQTIESLIEQGKYQSLSAIDNKPKQQNYDWETILQAKQFSTFKTSLFETTEPACYQLFDDEIRSNLYEKDSLCVWAEILLTESEALLDKASAGEIVSLFDENDSTKELDIDEIIERSKMLRSASVALYNKSINEKFDIYEEKYQTAIEAEPKIDFTEVAEYRDSAKKDFESVSKKEKADDVDSIKKLITVKNKGISSYTEGLERYYSHVDGSFPLPERKQILNEQNSVAVAIAQIDNETAKRGDKVFTIEADEAKEMANAVDNKAKEKAVEEKKSITSTPQTDNRVTENKSTKVDAIETKTTTPTTSDNSDATKYVADKPVYRIQLGAFRNKPDANKLKSYNIITKIEVAEKGLTKYYEGAYPTYSSAIASLANVKQNFPEAFIVAFYNGKQIKLSEAQKLE